MKKIKQKTNHTKPKPHSPLRAFSVTHPPQPLKAVNFKSVSPKSFHVWLKTSGRLEKWWIQWAQKLSAKQAFHGLVYTDFFSSSSATAWAIRGYFRLPIFHFKCQIPLLISESNYFCDVYFFVFYLLFIFNVKNQLMQNNGTTVGRGGGFFSSCRPCLCREKWCCLPSYHLWMQIKESVS